MFNVKDINVLMVQFVWDLRKWKLICKTCRKFGGADTSISNVSWKKELHINLKYMLPKVPVSWETLFSFHNFWSLLSTWNLFFFNIQTLGPGPAEFLAAQDTFRRVFRVTFWLCRNLLMIILMIVISITHINFYTGLIVLVIPSSPLTSFPLSHLTNWAYDESLPF